MEDVRRGAWWLLLDSTLNLRTIGWPDIAFAAEVSRTPLYRRWVDPAEAFVDAFLWHAGTSDEHVNIEQPWRSARMSLLSVAKRWDRENYLLAATRLVPLIHGSDRAAATWILRVAEPIAQDIRRCFVLSRTRDAVPRPDRAAAVAQELAALPFLWLSHLTAKRAAQRFCEPLEPAAEVADYTRFIDREISLTREREVGG